MKKRILCKKCGIIIAALLVHTAMWAAAPAQRKSISTVYPTKYKVWGGDPLQSWQNGLLSGNGKMGVIVFGNPLDETVVYCDRKFFWPPSISNPERTFNKVSQTDLKAIRDYCSTEQWKAANDLAHDVHGYKGGGEGSKHPGHLMKINIPENGNISNYVRECDFRTGEVIVKWTDNRGNWERRTFVSREDNVIVQYLTAPTGALLNCNVELGTDPEMRMNNFGMYHSDEYFIKISNNDFLNLRAKYPSSMGDAGFEGVTKIIVNGGTKSVSNNVLTVTGANSLLLLTRLDQYRSNRETEWNKQLLQAQLNTIATTISTDYNTLLQRHLTKHKTIFERMFLDLGASETDRALTNEELLAKQKTEPTAVAALWERVFDSGRYLFLSSSSEFSPPDLCGLWMGDSDGGWGGTYHLDANLNLQIGGGNIGNMPEAMEGFFTLIERLAAGFRKNADYLLGCRGMLGGGNTPGWSGLISDISVYYYSYQYVTGEMGWLLYPFWEYYLVTGDENFLKTRLYPLLREMGEFYEDFLVNKDANGKYIFAGSVSPENKPGNFGGSTCGTCTVQDCESCSVVNNSTFDIAGAKFCLETLLAICNKFGYDQGSGQGVERWTNILNSLPPYLINGDGALQEWSWPGLKENYGHRHSSHMITVWPLNEITKEGTPALYTAAQETLSRKDGGTYENSGHGYLMSGMSAANLNNAAAVNNKILHLLKKNYYFPSLASSHDPDFTVFCTDVVHTVPAMMMEMLVNSKNQVIELLPALPVSLTKGTISGLKTRNRVTIEDLTWDMNEQEIVCHLTSAINQNITLIQRAGIVSITGSNVTIQPSPIGDEARILQLQAGVTAEIILKVNKVLVPVNLALNRPVTVSGCENGNSDRQASNAVDGDAGTRWAANNADDGWIYVDLGEPKNITKICLRWEAAYAESYKLQISDNGNGWTDIYAKPNSTGGYECIPVEVTGRYVKMQGVKRAISYGFSLWELEVYGTDVQDECTNAPAAFNVSANAPSPHQQGATVQLTANVTAGSYQWYERATAGTAGGTAVSTGTGYNAKVFTPVTTTAGTKYYYCAAYNNTCKTTSDNSIEVTVNSNGGDCDDVFRNLALGKVVEASSCEDDFGVCKPNRVKECAVDGNTGGDCRWASGNGGQYVEGWIYVDLGEVKSVSRIDLYWEAAYAAKFRLEKSDNGSQWTDIFGTDLSGNLSSPQSIPVDVNTRYVRMRGIEQKMVNEGYWGYSLYEFEVWGTDVCNAVSITKTGNDTQITLFPNPTNGLLYVSGINNFDVQVFDIAGVKVLQKTQQNNSIDISSLAAGMYMINLRNKDIGYSSKVILLNE